MAPSSDTTTSAAEQTLAITRIFEAPPALVFRMWSEVEHLMRWHGPETLYLTHCEQDFREGGTWRRCMSSEAGYTHWISGVYKEIRPFDRLSFTYINAYDGHEMLVEMDFRDLGGRTEMQFRQSPFRLAQELKGHERGWLSSFSLLADYLLPFEGKEGPPFGRPRRDGVAEDLAAARERAMAEKQRRTEHADTAGDR